MVLGRPTDPRILLRRLGNGLTSLVDSNRAGQAYGFLAITPIHPDRIDDLKAALVEIDALEVSPFAGSGRTHFGRFVILDDFYYERLAVEEPERDYQPPDEDRLGCQYLIVSTCFDTRDDGTLDAYLDELAVATEDWTDEVWGCCIGFDAARPAEARELQRYLRHNQIDSGFFYSAYSDAIVSEVQDALADQRALRQLAVGQYDLTPAELQAQFLSTFPKAEAA